MLHHKTLSKADGFSLIHRKTIPPLNLKAMGHLLQFYDGDGSFSTMSYNSAQVLWHKYFHCT